MKTSIIFLVIFFIALSVFIVNRKQNKLKNTGDSLGTTVTQNPNNTSVDKNSSNPFGVMFASVNKVPMANALGVKYYRPLFISTVNWNGTCPECDAAINKGLKLMLNVRNTSGQSPATPPTNLTTYRNTISQAIDKYQPEILFIENEENSLLFYNGTPTQYLAELKYGCEVVHSKGIKCANGGLVSELVALLVTDDYVQKGQIDKANDYLQRSIGSKLEALFGIKDIDAVKLLDLPRVKEQVNKGKQLVAGYKTSGADYINFHWYIADTGTLETAKKYLEQSSGLRAITNEVGQQQNEDPEQVTQVMQKIVDLRLPLAIWFSVDVANYGGARSLLDENGNLRPNGEAFKNFISSQNY